MHSTLTRLRSGATLLGPAFVAAIVHVDPGNVATNTAARPKSSPWPPTWPKSSAVPSP